jgi:hypothetical protein
MTSHFRIGAAACAAALALFSSAASARDTLTAENKKDLPKDPKSACVVAGVIYAGGMGDLAKLRLNTSASPLPMETAGVSGEGDEFVFVDVPKGPFRLSLVLYSSVTGNHRNNFDFKDMHELYGFGKDAFRENPSPGYDTMKGTGNLPNELSGTCNGGFLWLGLYKATKSSLELGNDSVAAGRTLKSLKGELAGTPWANEIDGAPKNVPLPAGQEITASTAMPAGPKVASEVTLLNAGGSPKKALRYSPKAGDARPAVLSLVTGNKPGGNDPLPQVQFTLNTAVAAGTEPGTVKYSYTVTQASAAPSDAMGNIFAKMLTEPADGITGSVQFDNRGQHAKGDYQFAEGKKPKIGPPMSVVGGIASTVVPFPEEEVGEGGTWRVETQAEAPTFTTKASTTYKLESLVGEVAKISFVYESNTTFKKAINTGKAMMVGTVVEGTGSAQVNLKQLVPDSFKQSNLGTSLLESDSGPKRDAISSPSVTMLEGK